MNLTLLTGMTFQTQVPPVNTAIRQTGAVDATAAVVLFFGLQPKISSAT